MNRWGKTLADEPELMRKLAVHKHGFDPALTTTPVHAPCCRYVKAADAIRDLRAIEGTVVRAGNIRPPADLEWACDGCVWLLCQDPESGWTESKLIEAEGAPIAIVHELRAQEVTRNEIRELWGHGGEYRPQEIYDGTLAKLVREHRAVAEAEAVGAMEGPTG